MVYFVGLLRRVDYGLITPPFFFPPEAGWLSDPDSVSDRTRN